MRSRIARFAMRRRATVVGALVLVFVMAGTALAVAPGSNFRLGVINSISGYVTTLTGSNNGAMLAIKNTNTNSGSKGLLIHVPAGKPPIVVNGTAGKATGLNADKVDGKNASAFLPVGGKALDAFHADAADTATTANSATTAASATNAGNSDTVDGYSANELSRGTRAKGSSGTLTGSAATIGSVTLQAPRAGFVLVTAALEPYAASGCSPACQVGLYLTDGSFSTWNYYQPVGAAPTGFVNYQGSTTITSMFAAAAGTKTVNIQGWQSGGTGTVSVFYDVTAVFVPFGASGGGTLGAGSSSAASSAAGQ